MSRAQKIIQIYNAYGSRDYIGEDMTQIEHALQCAYHAKKYGYDEDIVIAALLHDIGHLLPCEELMGSYGVSGHEKKGATFLAELGYNRRICALVAHHVAAKRYLCTKDASYYSKLSEASKRTMKYQGGFMSEKELSDFEKDDYFEDSLKIRRLDDMGKVVEDMHMYGRMEDYSCLLL